MLEVQERVTRMKQSFQSEVERERQRLKELGEERQVSQKPKRRLTFTWIEEVRR